MAESIAVASENISFNVRAHYSPSAIRQASRFWFRHGRLNQMQPLIYPLKSRIPQMKTPFICIEVFLQKFIDSHW